MIVGFAMAAISQNQSRCFEKVKTEDAIEFMSQYKVSEERYLKMCNSTSNFEVYVLAFLMILVTVPFRAMFTLLLRRWEQYVAEQFASEDENQEDLAYQQEAEYAVGAQ